ncbi:hypothetical protein TRFO_16344 [Tritrichomonas foetus]|uniref:Uncharacterized protein n=1 Tax=Tritrichomonas foetus TaxID=1144522 RepID=A0A1J4KVD8_9EUKA|nr:hypothetical protein TRFO_16344 [Tritrichomonas foetus]|eukprot:OHT13477.1 hypothetical protein TRFO_16344 [Tritrichomonas foetus]
MKNMWNIPKVALFRKILKIYQCQKISFEITYGIMKKRKLKNFSSSSSDSSSIYKNSEALGKYLLDGGPIEDVEESIKFHSDQLVEFFRAERDKILDGGPDCDYDYDRLQLIDDLLQFVFNQKEQNLYTKAQLLEIQKLKGRIKEAKEQLKESQKNYKRLRKQFNCDRKDAIEQLKDQQHQEHQKLIESFEKVPEKYRKISNKLIILRKQEKHLRLTHRYMEAKQIKIEGDQVEKEEMEENLKHWNIEKSNLLSQLENKHQQQMNCLEQKWERTWNSIYPAQLDRKQHYKLVIDNAKKRILEITGNKNDFKLSTTKSVLQVRKDELRTVTSRIGAHQRGKEPKTQRKIVETVYSDQMRAKTSLY